MDLYAVRRIKNKKPVVCFDRAALPGCAVRWPLTVHPESCEAARVLEPVSFVGERGRGR